MQDTPLYRVCLFFFIQGIRLNEKTAQNTVLIRTEERRQE